MSQRSTLRRCVSCVAPILAVVASATLGLVSSAPAASAQRPGLPAQVRAPVAGSATFSCTRRTETLNVPPGVRAMVLDLYGASGGDSGARDRSGGRHFETVGGKGGHNTALYLIPGELERAGFIVNVTVGCRGSDGGPPDGSGEGGFNGGGSTYGVFDGPGGRLVDGGTGGGGGGRTDALVNTSARRGLRLWVAGGGGGGGDDWCGVGFGGPGDGGDGTFTGDANGGNGGAGRIGRDDGCVSRYRADSDAGQGGKGGGSTNGGAHGLSARGSDDFCAPGCPTDGRSVRGGLGAAVDSGGGGGGGGGNFGGGGGGAGSVSVRRRGTSIADVHGSGGGGGGGSGLVAHNTTRSRSQDGSNLGNGHAIIDYYSNPASADFVYSLRLLGLSGGPMGSSSVIEQVADQFVELVDSATPPTPTLVPLTTTTRPQGGTKPGGGGGPPADTTAPTVNSLSAKDVYQENKTPCGDETSTVSWSSSDNVAVVSVTISWSGPAGSGSTTGGASGQVAIGPFAFYGPETVTAVARDAAGNTGSRSAGFTVSKC